MLLISMTRSLIKLDNTVETKLEDINMTNHDDDGITKGYNE